MGISGTSSGFLLGYCTLRSSETPVARTGPLAVGTPRKGLGSFIGLFPLCASTTKVHMDPVQVLC